MGKAIKREAVLVTVDLWWVAQQELDSDDMLHSTATVMDMLVGMNLAPDAMAIDQDRFLVIAYENRQAAAEVYEYFQTPIGISQAAINYSKSHPRQMKFEEIDDNG